MANKTFTFDLEFTFKSEGNRGPRFNYQTTGTTVHRAFNKLAKDIQEGKWEALDEDNVVPDSHTEDDVRASDLMLLGASIIEKRRGRADTED